MASSFASALPRLVGGWFLLVLGGGLVLVAVLAGVSSVINGDIGAISGGVFVLIAASVLAQLGRVVLRGGNRPPPTVAASGPGSERAPHGQRSPLAGSPRQVVGSAAASLHVSACCASSSRRHQGALRSCSR